MLHVLMNFFDFFDERFNILPIFQRSIISSHYFIQENLITLLVESEKFWNEKQQFVYSEMALHFLLNIFALKTQTCSHYYESFNQI